MAVFLNSGFVFCFCFCFIFAAVRLSSSEPLLDKQALLSFLSKTPHGNRLKWNDTVSACAWVGVECDKNGSFVFALRLPAVGLMGNIPANTLGKLSQLRVLSLRSNRLNGSLPPDFSNLVHLRSLYLQDNRFSGEYPASLAESTRLIRLDLSSNNFTGEIPASVNKFTNLTRLYLQNNGFNGKLPNISISGLSDFDVSNNRLNGEIPIGFSNFPARSFAGNIDLCGGPLPPCNQNSPAPSPSVNPKNTLHHKSSKKLSKVAIAGIIIGSILAFLLLLLLLFLCFFRKTEQKTEQPRKTANQPIIATSAPENAGTSSSKEEVTGGGGAGGEKNRLVFFPGGGYSFELEDLLRASAEVLGKGLVGTSYKAVLEEGTTVVVKRLKDVTVNRKEFEDRMEILGRVKNENVLPFRAFYFSRDEKLLVFDYMPAGSLSALLHGSRGSGRTPLDWDSRMRIAISAARGLAYLHVTSEVVHGNIKASNILLKQDNHDACVSDYGLNPLFSATTPANHRVAGYRAPEVVETRKVTYKSDVYSFGVLLLELLTGKAPNQASLGEEGIDLPRWVQSVVREEWTAEVFDVELMRFHNVEDEMVQMLQIGMACVATVPDQRPTMAEVVRMIEEMHRDDGIRQSSDDPSKSSSPPGITP